MKAGRAWLPRRCGRGVGRFQSGDVRDAVVTQGVQVAEERVPRGGVVHPYRGGAADGGGVGADDDGRHPQLVKKDEAGVVGPGVDDDSVDALAGPPLVARLHLVKGARDQQCQCTVGGTQTGLQRARRPNTFERTVGELVDEQFRCGGVLGCEYFYALAADGQNPAGR